MTDHAAMDAALDAINAARRAIREGRDDAEDLLDRAVRSALESGMNWGDVADALGTTLRGTP